MHSYNSFKNYIFRFFRRKLPPLNTGRKSHSRHARIGRNLQLNIASKKVEFQMFCMPNQHFKRLTERGEKATNLKQVRVLRWHVCSKYAKNARKYEH